MRVFEKKIGFVGLGRMGGGMVANLGREAKDLRLYDKSEERRREFSPRLQVTETVDDLLGHVDVLMLSLPGSPEVEEVVGRFLQTDAAGKTVIDLSTSFPPSSVELHQRMTAAGGHFLDCGLSGGPANAADGTLTVMAGGEREVFELFLPVFEAFAKKVIYAGKSGSGNIMKLATNFISILYTALYAEIIPFVEKLGVDPQILCDAVSHSGSDSGMFQLYAPKMLARQFPISFQLALANKDLRYLKRLFEHEKLPSKMLDAGLELFDRAEELDLMAGDTAELVRVTRDLYGMS